ncbi:hypothetical protein TrLO_g642 [Triparma laevis f. longispina]|uniref:Uncharacterized protein n=1 Tax=Triparma laevis f. longispina TaxID=1714387 RepID=A0A9W7FHG4_9STRA|nr:hypothetical protein TrLO_g642 [Triparma laevis f. longispina]
MMLLNALNHFPYLLLYVFRSIMFPNVGSGERPFYYESMLFSFAFSPFGPWLYSEEKMNVLLVSIKEACLMVPPEWFFVYQIVEGTFHFMICFGWLFHVMGFGWGKDFLFKWGILNEMFWMDYPYVAAFQWVAFQVNSPLAHVCAIVHHLTVVPNLLWLWSWARDGNGVKAKSK